MAEAPQDAVITQIVDLIEGMTGARFWGGHYENAPRVDGEAWQDPQQVQEFPRFLVYEAEGMTTELDTMRGGSDGYLHALSLMIEGLVRFSDAVPWYRWKWRTAHDVFLTLTASPLGASLRWGPMRPDQLAGRVGVWGRPVTVLIYEEATTGNG